MAEENQEDQDTTPKTSKKSSKKVQRRGGKKKNEDLEEVDSYFDNYHELYAEFKSKKMPQQKVNALLKKLMELFDKGKITEVDQELMEEILRKGRLRGTLPSRLEYFLNQIEYDRLEDIAVVKSDDCPRVLHLKKDLQCKYFYDDEYNDGKNKPDSIGRYVIYIPRVIPPRHQLDYGAAMKLADKQQLTPEETPEPKTVIHRRMIKEKEFQKWFEIVDPDILKSGSVDPTSDTGSYEF